MLDFAFLDLPTGLHHLKPAQLAQALVDTLDRCLNDILYTAP
jgi:hypothetical protein